MSSVAIVNLVIGCVFVVAFLAYACYSSKMMKRKLCNSKRRFTLEYITQERQNPEYQKSLSFLRTLNMRRADASADYALDESVACLIEGRKEIITLLDHQNAVAAGVRLGVFDEKFFRELQWATVMHQWKLLSPFVYKLRETSNDETLYQDFECLAMKWEKEPVQLLKPLEEAKERKEKELKAKQEQELKEKKEKEAQAAKEAKEEKKAEASAAPAPAAAPAAVEKKP